MQNLFTNIAHNNQTAVIIIIIIMLMLLQSGRTRPFKLGSFLILPILYMYYIVSEFVRVSELPWSYILMLFVAAVIGIAIGIFRSSLIKYEVDPQTREIYYSNSPVGVLVLVVIMLIKEAIKYFTRNSALYATYLGNSLLLLSCCTLLTRRFLMIKKYYFLKAKV